MDDTSLGPSEEVYALYKRFREDYRRYCMASSPTRQLRQHYRDNTGPLNESEFEEYFGRLSDSRKSHLLALWRRGFKRWLDSSRNNDRKFLRRVREWGIASEVEESARAALGNLKAGSSRR